MTEHFYFTFTLLHILFTLPNHVTMQHHDDADVIWLPSLQASVFYVFYYAAYIICLHPKIK